MCLVPLGQVITYLTADDAQAVVQQELASFLDEVNFNPTLMVNLCDHVITLTDPITRVLRQPCHGVDTYAYQKWHRAKLACLFYFTALSLQNEAVV